MREENLHGSLDGLCAGCKTEQDINFKNEWHLNTLYKIGNCPSCHYEHLIFVKKI